MLVTLLTDFGLTDSYVAEVKAAILSLRPATRLVDITHNVAPGDIDAARYLLGRSWRRFPAGTVHLVIVDPGVGTQRRILAAAEGGHFFVGPDNGVLSPVVGEAVVVALPLSPDAAPTFQGRDVMASAAARLAGGLALEALGHPVDDPVVLPDPVPSREQGTVRGVVRFVDRFGNLITNIPAGWVRGAMRVEVEGTGTGPLLRTFGDAAPGNLLAYVGSAGTVEIAVRDGSAAQRLGAGIGSAVTASLS